MKWADDVIDVTYVIIGILFCCLLLISVVMALAVVASAFMHGARP